MTITSKCIRIAGVHFLLKKKSKHKTVNSSKFKVFRYQDYTIYFISDQIILVPKINYIRGMM